MQVVGNCPQCGAPIWSDIAQNSHGAIAPPWITYSCECRLAKTPVTKCDMSQGEVDNLANVFSGMAANG